MRRISLGIICTLFVGLLIGCNQPKGDSNIKVVFPDLSGFQSISSQSVSAMNSTTGEDWNSSLNPSVIGDIDCFGVAIGDSEGLLNWNFVHDQNDAWAFDFGPWDIGYTAGSTLEIDVPSGPARIIRILGWKTQNGACYPSKYTEPQFNDMSYPYVIGTITADLAPGEVNVNIPVSMSGAYPVHMFSGADFDFPMGGGTGGGQNLYGDGRDGDQSFTTANFSVATYDLSAVAGSGSVSTAKKFNAPRKVSGISTDGMTLNFASITADYFEVGDEVMWHIMGGSDTTSPDSTACAGIPRGVFRFQHVTATTGTSITFSDSIDPGLSTGDYTTLNTNLGNSAVPGSLFCRMHVVRVPNFNNLTLNGNFNINSSDYLNGGGIIVFRATNLILGGNTNLDVGTRGFMATVGKGGDGFAGQGQPNDDTGAENGGQMGSSSNGSGGGSAAASGGMGSSSVPGGMAITYCLSTGGVCFPIADNKVIFGGGGGSSGSSSDFGAPSYAGGRGGGAIIIHAENISGTASLGLLATGGDGQNDGTYYSGGGAGGVIHLTTTSIGTGVTVNADASGGLGGVAGGGGAGGVVEIPYCASQSTGTISTPDVTGGTGYAAGGNGAYNVVDEPTLCN